MMEFKVGDKVKILNTEFGNQGRVGTITTISGTTMIYLVEIVGAFGKDCQWSNTSDLELVTEEEKVMKFKVGDKVKVSDSWRGNSGKVGTISRTDWGTMYKYRVEFEDADPESFKEEELESVKEEETTMEFKVGDRVRMIRNTYGHRGKIGTLEKIDTSTMPYCVVFDDGRKEWCYGNEFKLLKEEKVMKLKVGDKVKVKDSWFGHDGQVGVVLDTDNYEPYNYNIKFDTEGDNGRRDENFMEDSLELVTEEEETTMKLKVGDKVKVSNSWDGNTGNVGEITERSGGYQYPYCVTFEAGNDESFKEEELELVKEKQSFTKSDLKTGMGVVLRDGSKGHVLLGTEAGDVIRFINGGSNQWASVDEYDENMIDCDTSAMDLIEVYSSRFAYACLTDRVFNQDCVFKREEPKSEPKPEPEPTKMTMKEINEHFGKAIEIVE